MKNTAMSTMNMMMCCNGMQMYRVMDVFHVCYKA